MKNFKLLLATTTILSTGAFIANALYTDTEYNVQIHADAKLVKSYEVKETKRINFGTIVTTKAGQQVVVNADGTLGEATTATLLVGSAQSGDAQVPADAIQAGQISVEGIGDGRWYDMSINTGTITLKAGNVTCGVATIAADNMSNSTDGTSGTGDWDGDTATIDFGGTFVLDSQIESNMSTDLDCTGAGTITIMNDVCTLTGDCEG